MSNTHGNNVLEVACILSGGRLSFKDGRIIRDTEPSQPAHQPSHQRTCARLLPTLQFLCSESGIPLFGLKGISGVNVPVISYHWMITQVLADRRKVVERFNPERR